MAQNSNQKPDDTYEDMETIDSEQVELHTGAVERQKRNKKAEKWIMIFVGAGVVIALCILIPVAVVLSQKDTAESTPKSPAAKRVDCIPDPKMLSEAKCKELGCVYEQNTNGPSCYIPKDTFGYKVHEEKRGNTTVSVDVPSIENTEFGMRVSLTLLKGLFNPIKNITLEMWEMDDNYFRFKFYDPNNARYEVPVTLNNQVSAKARRPRYEFKITSMNPFSFQVIRRSTEAVLWDTSVGGLNFADQFLQIATLLPSENVYGFGENLHKSLRHDLNYKTWPMFARDQPPGWAPQSNLYGVHPFYTCLENDGQSHGVFLLNSNAMDYTFSPDPMLTYRTIGGVLDFYFFLGPTPENVIQQYTGLIGRPYMPPYWSLGFQLCRYGYNNISNLRDAVDRTRKYNIPHDVQYADIDHMEEQKDFTFDKKNFAGLDGYFEELQSGGMHTIIILDPAIISNVSNYTPYSKGFQKDVYIKWPDDRKMPEQDYMEANNTRNMLGYVWPNGKVVFPDFFLDETKQWWADLIKEHYEKELKFDGLWIDMNEPANFGTNENKPWNWPATVPGWSLICFNENDKLENPPYRTKAAYLYDKDNISGNLSDKTICMFAKQNKGAYDHYDVHSLYGWSQTEATLRGARAATPGKRSIVIARSTYPSSGKYAGHWLGDNDSEWEDLHQSIIGSLEFNMFGIPYIGSDICGFWLESNAEMCGRWMQLGAFYTFSRNHNGKGTKPQDPGYYGEAVAKMSREALLIRYRLLPYLYTLFHNAHIKGNTVMRPVMHEFPLDSATWGIDQQFMWGPALLISPILHKGQTLINYYLPKGTWYDYHTRRQISSDGKQFSSSSVQPDSPIPLHVRGGYILPGQEPANNTVYSRRKPFELLVALDDKSEATGELFWDDGDSIDTYENGNYFLSRFKSTLNSVSMHIQHNNISFMASLNLGKITVLGLKEKPGVVYVDGNLHVSHQYHADTMVLEILQLGNMLKMDKDFTVTWWETSFADGERERLDCWPEVHNHRLALNEQTCHQRGCTWGYTQHSKVPVCYLPKDKVGYTIKSSNDTALGQIVDLQWKNETSMFGKDIEHVQLVIEELDNHLLHFKFIDPNNPRYEVPVPLTLPNRTTKASDPLYRYEVGSDTDGIFYLRVIRKSTNRTIWDTSIGGFIYGDQFLQIVTRLPSKNIYGFGENRHFSLRHSMDFQTWPMFARDQAPGWGDYSNMYGVHPYYTCLEDTQGNMHGVFLLNSNAMEYKFQPGQSLTYRSAGGILDFYVFMGPSPEEVVQQYTQVIGFPVMPPYWALGFQLCRYGYNSLETMKEAYQRTVDANIPYDVQYADIDHMDERLDFTIDNDTFYGLPEFVDEIKTKGMRFIIILDPALITNVSGYRPYELGLQKDVFIKWPTNYPEINVINPDFSEYNSHNMLGYVWPKGKVVFPDFLNPNTSAFWKELIVDYYKNKLKFDGLWIDMNEPANFGTNNDRSFNWPEKDKPYWTLKCPENMYDDPAYKPRSIFGPRLSDKTLCMVGIQNNGKRQYLHYDVHSLYGWSQSQPTLLAAEEATGKRSMVISRSTYPGSGRYAGHWLGDNDSKWSNLRDSVIGIIEFNMFGIPYIGADICGFFGESNAQLCQRWMQLGAFYSYSRNHNGLFNKPQDPAYYGPAVTSSSRDVLETRYTLLPYLYTLFYKAHTTGTTVIRPLLHEFPSDQATWDLDSQFMWGSALLISPVLTEDTFRVEAYFPQDRWFDYYTGAEISPAGRFHILDAPLDYLPLHIRGGHILPTQKPANNTYYSRMNPFGLIVAPNSASMAEGLLYWDEGENTDLSKHSLMNFTYENNELQMEIMKSDYDMSGAVLNTVRIFGVDNKMTVTVNTDNHDNVSYYSLNKELFIQDLGLPMNRGFTIKLN